MQRIMLSCVAEKKNTYIEKCSLFIYTTVKICLEFLPRELGLIFGSKLMN